jgi:hypothetical protein
VPAARLSNIHTFDEALGLARKLMPNEGMTLTDNFAESLLNRARALRGEV